jgi:putative drug exporter of the RND superfamily
VGARRARAVDPEGGFWARHSRSVMRRPGAYLAVGTLVLLGLAAPALFLHLTPGSLSGIPGFPESMRGYALLRDRVGAGAVMPTEIAVDGAGPARAAISRLADRLFHDPEVLIVASGTRPPFVDASGRYARVIVAGRHEYGARQTQSLVRRIRTTLIPAARFPAAARVYAGGAPAQGVDFLERTYGVLPWLVLAVLVLTYLVLLRAFRSVVLPLKAVVLNLLSVAAACGMLVLVFQWGRGQGQIEGWVPIVLFATLFGISMDYEVFMVTRMRESWDHVPDNARAVAHGLQRTGRIVTAAAVIMVAAFSGFVAGRVQGLQELGLGLALAILLDATIIRAVLVPSLMAVLGRWNWWLPARK